MFEREKFSTSTTNTIIWKEMTKNHYKVLFHDVYNVSDSKLVALMCSNNTIFEVIFDIADCSVATYL